MNVACFDSWAVRKYQKYLEVLIVLLSTKTKVLVIFKEYLSQKYLKVLRVLGNTNRTCLYKYQKYFELGIL